MITSRGGGQASGREALGGSSNSNATGEKGGSGGDFGEAWIWKKALLYTMCVHTWNTDFNTDRRSGKLYRNTEREDWCQNV